MFIAMNRFRVRPERSEEFEQRWHGRESYLQDFAGFIQFALLRGDTPGEYISHSTWTSREAFNAWARSERFRKVHERGLPEGILLEHPRPSFYDAAVVVQSAERAGV